MSGVVSISTEVVPSGPSRSTSIEQRRRRFFGFLGSQSPQWPPIRGTPPEEPEPRMVKRISPIRPRPHDSAAFQNRRSKLAWVWAAKAA